MRTAEVPHSRRVQTETRPSGFGVECVTPLGVVEYTEEAFGCDESVQVMEFFGESSEIMWLHRLKRDLDEGTATPKRENTDRPSISSVNYFQDESEVGLVQGVDLAARPSQQVADKLIDDYFKTVYPTFPVIDKMTFLHQYRTFYSNPSIKAESGWLAMFNVIIAIAARHSLFVDNWSLERFDEHEACFSRSWWLSNSSDKLLDHPKLQQVQTEALIAFYLLSVNQVSRSWKLLEVAIRSAVLIGLNRSEYNSSETPSNAAYRVWWGLFTLENVLCVMTGRPPCTQEFFCTTPLPLPYDEENLGDQRMVQLITDQGTHYSSMATSVLEGPTASTRENEANHINPGQHWVSSGRPRERYFQSVPHTPTHSLSPYFLFVVQLSFLAREAINTLYAPGALRLPWLEIESTISTLNDYAGDLFSRLPAEFHFAVLDQDPPFVLERTGLAFRFYAAKLIILQPCLLRCTKLSCPGSVCETMATMCVQMAGHIIDLLPDEVDVAWLYTVTPWWCILHYIMQSASVLLVALFNQDQLGNIATVSIGEKIKKTLQWLSQMSTKDTASLRAWLVCVDILSRHDSKLVPEVGPRCSIH